MNGFSGKIALVTGGTRGIGKSIVKLLRESGCEVFYTGTRKSKETKNERSYLQLDLSDVSSIQRFLAQIRSFPRIDILINNAGINIIEAIDEIKPENWNKVIAVNLTGPMLLMKEVVQIMKKNKTEGKILNISSIFGIVSRARRNAYSASKAGLIGLTRATALDLAPYGILVNALCPGFTMTDLTKSILSKEEIKQLCLEIPLGRFASEEEIAKSALFFCSDMNKYITGQTIIVDGGYTIT